MNIKGSEATMQSYGWTGINNHHLVAFMITANKKVQTVDVHNTTADRHTAENYLGEIEEVYGKLLTDWDVIPVVLVTDASGEARKARRLFSLTHSEMIVLDCYSHQSQSALLNWTEPATQLIAWLRSKSRILSHLPLAVLQAVITRWTAHYMAFLKPDDLKVLVAGDTALKNHARKMVNIIENATFWQNIALMTRYLEPLAITANVVQASFCRIDQVLLTFGYLVERYRSPLMDNDITSRDAILDSIEKRWAKTDQQVFICSVLLNPFYGLAPFASLHIFSRANIQILCEFLFQRFYKKEAPYKFGLDIYQYLDGTGETFKQLKSQVDWELKAAENQKHQPDPLAVYAAIATPGKSDESGFFPFVRRLLSVSANSASCECLFSLRNKLGDKTLIDLTEVKMHIHDEHIGNKVSKQRLKRRFEPPTATGAPDNEPQNVNATSKEAGSQEKLNKIVANLLSVPIPTVNPLNERFSTFKMYSNMDTDAHSDEAAPDSFADLIRHNIELVHNVVDAVPIVDIENWSKIKIDDLFDFSHISWSTMYGAAARISFEEKLALYELLDRDAEGDEDLDDPHQPSFDTTTEDILLS
ncbi:hypothetical protein BJ912DRAFT_1027651 [Pholiota molesta]|nr:hypothetical protein BJ912DRAFT_1027651 [Pholiota molesta]